MHGGPQGLPRGRRQSVRDWDMTRRRSRRSRRRGDRRRLPLLHGGSLDGMPDPAVSLQAVTTLFLERQHLARPRAATLTTRRLGRFVEDVGGIQLDSINVLDRAHYLTVWSRFGPYDRAWLDRAVYRRRILFEYWAHAACLVPATTLPWWRRAMLDYRVRHTGWSDWLRRNPKVLSRVKSSISLNGPMGGADFEGRRPAGK